MPMRIVLAALFVLAAGVWSTAVAQTSAYGARSGIAPSEARGELRLPSDHRYQMYDAEAAAYRQIDESSIPRRIQAGESIYDRTADAWVFRPGWGVNPRYVGGTADGGDVLRIGRYVLPRDHVYQRYASGEYRRVDPSSVPRRIERGQWIYDRTAQEWVFHEDMGRNPRYLAGDQYGDWRDREWRWRERASRDDCDWRDGRDWCGDSRNSRDRRGDWRSDRDWRDDWRSDRDWRDDRAWRGERE
jgi:hypothetical protein